MQYNPVSAVWEITMGCNMRCEHCGSSCEEALAGELTTKEAFELCDELAELGLEWITLSGGEPTTRDDWYLIAERLSEHGIVPNIITNGWILDEKMIDKAINAGVGTMAISIDGLENTHDEIRREDSFARAMSAFDLMNRKDMYSAAITTISSKNIDELRDLKELLISKGVERWQLQIALPMGNFTKSNELVIEPEKVNQIIDFAYEVAQEEEIIVDLADCLGYYNLKEIEVRKQSAKGENSGLWNGCTAGKNSFGILHNGDILGCTSIRDEDFIEGNIRETSLIEIWNNDSNFSWNREFASQELSGFCEICKYGEQCLGGCPNLRLVIGGDIDSENKYCSYNIKFKQAQKKIDKINNVQELAAKGKKLAEKDKFQLAEMLIRRALKLDEHNIELLNLYGYIHYMLENYTQAKELNEKVLEVKPNNTYANKGLGLSLVSLGEVEAGIEYLQRAVELADDNYTDPYYDLAVVLAENDRKEEAISVLEQGRKISKDFVEKSQGLYERLVG
ncbi:MAG: radical SAM protein [Bacillota bacterium]